MKIDLVWGNELEKNSSDCVVVIDTFRATTNIPVALGAQAKQVISVKDKETAEELAGQYNQVILAGERHGIPLAGFDCGNSPLFMKEQARGKTVILSSNNFSRQLEDIVSKSETQAVIVVASLVNAKAVAEFIKENNFSSVTFVAVGTYNFQGVSYVKTEEDKLTAEYIIAQLKNEEITKIGEKVRSSHYGKYLANFFDEKQRLENLADMEICVDINSVETVPKLTRKNDLFVFKK